MFRQGKGVHFCFLFFLLAASVCLFLNLHSCWLKSWFAWWYSFSLDISACVSFRWTRSSRRRDSSLPSKAMALFSDNFNLFCRASLLMFNSSNFFWRIWMSTLGSLFGSSGIFSWISGGKAVREENGTWRWPFISGFEIS